MVTIYQPYLIDADDEEWRVEGPLYSEAKLAMAFVEGYSAYRYGLEDQVRFNEAGSHQTMDVPAHAGPYRYRVGGYKVIRTVA